MTPIWVLHRRSPLTREKIIYKIGLEKINNSIYVCYLSTSAGTYIKEFVHSDLGRTEPSLSSLVGQRLDII